MRPRLVATAILLAFTVATTGCGSAGPTHDLTVFGAASLTESFTALATSFEEQHPDVHVTLNFAGSRRLVSQLGFGARADILATASATDMQAARRLGLVSGDVFAFAGSDLVVVVATGNPAAIASPVDLARPGSRVSLADPAVPAGVYSRMVLNRLATAPGAGQDYVQSVLANVVSLEDDVKQIVAKVSLGEVDAGLVYSTDARTAGLATVVLPDQYNEQVVYYVGVATDAPRAALAQRFVQYALRDDGQRIFARYGFRPISKPPVESGRSPTP